MRFTTAWASVLSQNLTLRTAITALSICSLFFVLVAARLALRDPIVIERSCFSKALSPSSAKHTDAEINAFLREAIPIRFDPKAKDVTPYLSVQELSFRMREQEELSKKGMSQKVVVNEVKSTGKEFLVDTDRIISVGKVRSAVPFQLKVELRSTSRTAGNPYGLILLRVSQGQEMGESK